MQVRSRLSLLFTLLFGMIFLIISFLIYFVYSTYAEKYIFENLKKTSYITALFYLEEDELNTEDFKKIKDQFNEFVNNSFYQIYNEKDSLCYGSDLLNIKPQVLNDIRKTHSLAFSDKEFFCYGIFYEDNQGDFVVITREKKDINREQVNMLLWVLVVSFLVGVVGTIFISRWMAGIVYKPFRKVIDQVNKISTNNLDVQIELPSTEDELQDLIKTFNNLLSKISETVIIQKNFVSFVSHEFKTPLASILGNLEVFSLKDRSPKEYEELSTKLIQEIYQLEDMLTTLLIISDLRKEAETPVQLRIDELIWQIINNVTDRYPQAKLRVNIDIKVEDEYLLVVNIDRTELLMALFNLIENAVKYSKGNVVEISMNKSNEFLLLSIVDKGIGIPKDKLENISKPFFRGANASLVDGNGIGLSIALRILEKNKIEYQINSEVNKGTQVTLIFKEIKKIFE